MKKYILSIAVIATAAIAGWNYQQNQESIELSDLALDNVEALAEWEIEIGVPCAYVPITCYTIDDEFGHTVIEGVKAR